MAPKKDKGKIKMAHSQCSTTHGKRRRNSTAAILRPPSESPPHTTPNQAESPPRTTPT